MAAIARSSTLAALVCALVVPVGSWASSPSAAPQPGTSQTQAQVSVAALTSAQGQNAQKPKKPKKGKKKGHKKGTRNSPWSPTSPPQPPIVTAPAVPTPASVTATAVPTPRSTPTAPPTVVRTPTPTATPTVPAVPSATPTPTPTAAPTYALMKDRLGNVPRWDPCAGPITVKLSTPGLAAADEAAAEAELIWALGQLRDTTGLTFSYAGRTSELASMTTQMTTAQIVVSYATTAQSSLLASDGEAVGFGGSWIAGPARLSGFVAINTDTTGHLPRTFGVGGATRPAVLLHELGHVVGLDHVASDVELMSEWLSEKTPGTFAAGDRLGLQQLGAAQGCAR